MLSPAHLQDCARERFSSRIAFLITSMELSSSLLRRRHSLTVMRLDLRSLKFCNHDSRIRSNDQEGEFETRRKDLRMASPAKGAPDTLALRRMFRFHFRDGHFPNAE